MGFIDDFLGVTEDEKELHEVQLNYINRYINDLNLLVSRLLLNEIAQKIICKNIYY